VEKSRKKKFFFEKKNQKTFLLRFARWSNIPALKLKKFFCYFLFTKSSSFFAFLAYSV
jgi:hypothetical protein